MVKSFNYYNRKNPMQWGWLIFNGIFVFLWVYLFVIGVKDGEILYPLIIPFLFNFIVVFIFINRLFLAKIVIKENEIEYRSPFKKITIRKEKIQAIEIIKHRRRRTPKYLSLTDKPDINFGRYFLIVRGYYKPEARGFLLFSPVKDNYITAEYREELMLEILKLKPE